MTRKWNIVNDNLKAKEEGSNKINYHTKAVKSNLCDYNDVYISVNWDITITAHQAIQVAFKNCAPFTKSITQIDGTTIDDAENLDLVIPIYNLIEQCSGNLWFY